MEQRANGIRKARTAAGQGRGFSVLELMVVVGLIMIITAMALIQLQPALQQNRGAAAAAEVKSVFRQGRETALSARRTVQVQILTGLPCQANTGCFVLTRLDPPANVPTVILTVPLQSSVKFMQFSGEPDTPDAFGNAGPIVFGGVVNGPPTMEFQSDGTFTDGNGNVINGTIFLGIPNYRSSAFAVTILGGTGRIHSYGCAGSPCSY